MKCPICNNEMKEGVVKSGSPIKWIPMETHKTKLRILDKGYKLLANIGPFSQAVCSPSAYYCEHCNKVMGMFDVRDTIF